ncbi:hypothetical protein BH18ACT4_BH18ACT4_14830 [soil metagenome]
MLRPLSDKGYVVLHDGRYDAFVVDVSRSGDEVALELTIVAGTHKGEMVTVPAARVAGLRREPIELLGLALTLVVEDGRSRLEP